MKLKNYIFRGLSLLMLLCVYTTQVSAFAMSEKQVVQQEDDNQQPVFRQLSQETVVPSYVFSFGDFQVFCPEKSLEITFQAQFSPSISRIYPIESSYLSKIFEHHIATNAP